MFEELISRIASMLGTDTTVAGAVVSCLFTASMVIAVIIACKGKNVEVPVLTTSTLMIIMFTMVGWLNIWISLLVLMSVAVSGAWYLSKRGVE